MGTTGGMRLLIIAAVVLSVLAVIATATPSGTALGVSWMSWLCAALLAFFTDLLVGWTIAVPWRSTRTDVVQPRP